MLTVDQVRSPALLKRPNASGFSFSRSKSGRATLLGGSFPAGASTGFTGVHDGTKTNMRQWGGNAHGKQGDTSMEV